MLWVFVNDAALLLILNLMLHYSLNSRHVIIHLSFWMTTKRGMQICISVFSARCVFKRGPGSKHLSLRAHVMFFFSFLKNCWFSLLDSLASCLAHNYALGFPWWVELANSQDKFDGDVWTRSWEPLQHCGPGHQLLLQLYNVLRRAWLLLARCPGSLVLSLHSCFSLTNSSLVPPLGTSGPFLWQLWLAAVQCPIGRPEISKGFRLRFLAGRALA